MKRRKSLREHVSESQPDAVDDLLKRTRDGDRTHAAPFVASWVLDLAETHDALLETIDAVECGSDSIVFRFGTSEVELSQPAAGPASRLPTMFELPKESHRGGIRLFFDRIPSKRGKPSEIRISSSTKQVVLRLQVNVGGDVLRIIEVSADKYAYITEAEVESITSVELLD